MSTQQEWLEQAVGEVAGQTPSAFDKRQLAGHIVYRWPSSPQGLAVKQVMEAAQDVIAFCWGEKGWIGTENIGRSGTFLALAGALRDAQEAARKAGLV